MSRQRLHAGARGRVVRLPGQPHRDFGCTEQHIGELVDGCVSRQVQAGVAQAGPAFQHCGRAAKGVDCLLQRLHRGEQVVGPAGRPVATGDERERMLPQSADGAGEGLHPARCFPELVELLTVVRQGVRPRHARRLSACLRDASADRVEHRHPVRIRTVKRVHQAIELLAQAREALGLARPVFRRSLARTVERGGKLLHDLCLFRFGRVQFQAERPESDVVQSPVDDRQRRQLFRHEKDGLALPEAVRNEIGDGLALAGTGWTFEDQVASGIDGANRLQLRRVGQQRRQDVLRPMRHVQVVELALMDDVRKRLAGILDEMLHDPVGLQLLAAVLEVFPHQVLGEGENSQVGLLQHLPLGNLGDGEPECLQHAGHVEALVVQGKRLQPGDAKLETGLEQLQERRVDDGFVVMSSESEARSNRLALQRHRDQQYRRAVHDIGLVDFRPLQQADGKVQGVGAAFFQADARGGVDGQQMAVERIGLHARQQLVLAQRLECHVVQRTATRAPVGVHLRYAGIGAFHEVGQGANLEVAPFEQRVFQQRKVGSDQLQRGLRRLEIEQPVAQRQVEQARFPLRQAPVRRVIARQVERAQGVDVELGQVRHRLDGRWGFCRFVFTRRGDDDARWQGFDLQFASPVDVHRIAEGVSVLQVGQTLLHGDPQARPMAVVSGHAGGLEHQQLATVDALAHGLHVIGQRVGKARRVKPHTYPGVRLLHQHDGAQARLFEGRGEQQGEVQAGGDAAFQDAVRRADFLSVGAERCGRLCILKTFGRHGAVDRRNLLPDVLAAFRLVAVQGQLAVRRVQQLRGLADELVDGRVVGHAKRCQQFGQCTGACPLVVCQDLDRPHGAADGCAVCNDLDGNRRPYRFRKTGQKRMVGMQVDRGNPSRFTGRQPVEPQLQAFREGRIADDAYLHVRQGLDPVVGQPQRPHDGHGVLYGGIAERCIGLDLYDDGGGWCPIQQALRFGWRGGGGKAQFFVLVCHVVWNLLERVDFMVGAMKKSGLKAAFSMSEKALLLDLRLGAQIVLVLLQPLLLQLLGDLRLDFIELRQLGLADVVDPDDVITELRLDWNRSGFTLVQFAHGFRKLRHEVRWIGPVEVAALGARTRVLRLLLGEVFELGALLEIGQDLVGLLFGGHQNVARLVLLATTDSHELVVLACDIGVGHRVLLAVVFEQRADQDGLACQFKLVFIVVGGVELLLLRFLHEHFTCHDFVTQLRLHLGGHGASRTGELLGQHFQARLGHGLAVDHGDVLRRGADGHGAKQGGNRGGLQNLFFHELVFV